MTDDRSLPLDHEPLNREERRAARFRPNAGRRDPHAVAAEPAADETAGKGGDDAEASARTGGGDVTRRTGAGSGGPTESAGRQPHDEAKHLGNVPNG
jgi:hypothetical protein